MIIGLDIDNCLIATTQAVLEQHYADTNERLQLEDITAYCIENFISEEYKYDFDSIFFKKETWQRAKIIDECVEVVERLYKQGHQIYFVTATNPLNVGIKIKILQQAFPFINVSKRLITTPLKQIIDLDVLIDDCVDNVVNAKHYYSILLDYAWNSSFDEASDEKIYRVYHWSHIEPMIEYIQKLISLEK